MAFLRILGLTLGTFAVAWCIYSWHSLLRNYLVARKLGIPLRLLPISHGNPFWMIVDRKVVTFLRKLPLLGNDNFTRYNWRGWEVREKCRSHLEMGPVWMHVTPGRNWLYICDPETLVDIFRRRTDFPRPLELFAILDVFGDNLATVDGDQWKKHRKIASSCFNEANNAIVWSESLSQADDMMRYWTARPAVSSIADDLRTLSLHVLSRAGFGKAFKFQAHHEKAAVATNYKESLKMVLDNCVLIMALGTKFLSKPWLPARLRRVYQAYVAFQQYLTNLYESEKQHMVESHSTADRTLMSTLIQASAEETESTSLTERELYGNMFLFNFAGHDTTTHTLTFALMYLAINPQVQDWIAEEIASVSDWDYPAAFPRLTRCTAVLMETLRLYTPVPVAKWTDSQPQQLSVGGNTITVPADTMVIASYAAVHTHPAYWGADALAWRPSRWIQQGTGDGDDKEEQLMTPRRGTFIAWSEGERSCPGRKFSQVEFVATVAALFRGPWRVEPTRRPREGAAEARDRVLRQLETDSAQVLLLQMLHPERAVLSWKKKEG
ncbi:hypothetical protein PG985_016017 [Apiospora marii]|uniref:uncharacterized protein n=1 Tax=Apiospora marii TaxID=335849 RepID=UPI00312D15B3